MPFTAVRVRSRLASLVLVAVIHVLLVGVFWRLQVDIPSEGETFTSVMLLLSSPRPHDAATTAAAGPVMRRAAVGPAVRARPAPVVSSSAISLPTNSPISSTPERPKIDWYAQLEGAASSSLEISEQRKRQLGALTRKYQDNPDSSIPAVTDRKGFRWYNGGVLRVDTHSSVPVLHLNDRCVLVAFLLPLCAIGHIEVHGDLFDNAVKARTDLPPDTNPSAAQ